MNGAVFVIVSCLCLYASTQDIQEQNTVWGNVNARHIGTHSIDVPSTIFQVKVRTFTFPDSPLTVPIMGIRHTDYKQNPVSVKFLAGGIGFRNVTIEVTSQRGHGINSVFNFYAN